MSGEPTFFTRAREKIARRGRVGAFLASLLVREKAVEITLLLGITGAFFVAAFILSTRVIVRSADTVTLPDLVGRDGGDAAVWLAARGLHPEIDHFENDDKAAPLSVIYQLPAAGEDVRPGNVVHLVLCRGARSSPVPEVRGAALSQARLILERNGLVAGEPLEVFDPAPPGTILATAPGANAGVPAGATIALLASRGPAPREWIVPDIAGSLFDGAREHAEALGLTLSVVSRMHASDEPEGAILEQSPSPGGRIVEGEALRVTVNGDAPIAPPQGGADLIPISVLIPRGFGAHSLTVRLTRGAWTRILFDEPVAPGTRVRVVAAVLPGDRAVATLDGRDVLVRRF